MDYHALSEKEVIEEFNSGEEGLSQKEAFERLKKYGENRLEKTRNFSFLKIILEQFKSFLIIVLIFAGVLAFFMESKVDAVVIFGIIILNAGLGFFQEFKAERAISELRKMMVSKTKVLRNGRIEEILSEKVVPGDILILNEGDNITADARILSLNGLKVNESSLTGESEPESKSIGELNVSTSLADRINMVYQGTNVVSGNAKAIVISTGMNTELGKISGLVQEIKSEKNPFNEKLDKFATQVGIIILILSGLIVGLLYLDGIELLKSFLVAISLAVSAIPEGLPAVISLTLAFATKRMIKKNVLIRKLSSSETLGRVSVICTDKTGTLTEGKMEVISIYTSGSFDLEKNSINKELLLKTGVLCNKARIEKNDDGEDYFIGDPTEAALIVSAKNNSIDKRQVTEEEHKIVEFAFDSNRKIMSVVRQSKGKKISYVKGAPEEIIKKCSYELIDGRKLKLNNESRERLLKTYELMAKRGLRVLGFAFKEIISSNSGESEISINDAENELVFIGYQGMIDPPRKEVRRAIKLCNEAGIRVIMVTGDSRLTALAVASDIGLVGKSIESKELAKISDKELFDRIDEIAVFSRISPQDKLRIINILKQKNEVVAMTGDGVNDALALKRADIGIAMGIRGTDVARDSSDIVLIDDNFASIVEGVREGRVIYDNVKKFIKLLLSANFSEVTLVLFVMLLWKDPLLLPLLPLQILWINLITDSFPALALANEGAEENVMRRKPNKKGILNEIKGFIILAGIIDCLIAILFFVFFMDNINKARTMVVTSSIMFEMFLAFNCKSKGFVIKSPINKYLIYAVLFSIGLHMLVLYTNLNSLFYFVHIGIFDWLYIIGACFVGFLIIEGYKVFENKREKRQ